MSAELTRERLDWLAAARRDGEVHTVRVAWTDRLGAWRGKRLPVDVFLDSPERRLSFCDGMIVVDVNCDVIQETPFSNFDTGYPDMYLRPRPETLRPVGWRAGEAFVLGTLESHHGERLGVAPANVLDAVARRLAAAGTGLRVELALGGRLLGGRRREEAEATSAEAGMALLRSAAEGLDASGVEVRSLELRPGGRFRFALAAAEPAAAAVAATIAKAALKEVAAAAGMQAVFMTLLPGETAPAELGIGIELEGTTAPPSAELAAALRPLRGLLQPSVNAFKAGPPRVFASATAVDVRAAGEADPATAIAAVAAALGAADAGSAAATADPEGLLGAAALLEESAWAREWLGRDYVENAVPLLCHEAGLYAAAVTDWELDRYWSAG